jgi:hypothetical protein
MRKYVQIQRTGLAVQVWDLVIAMPTGMTCHEHSQAQDTKDMEKGRFGEHMGVISPYRAQFVRHQIADKPPQ